MKAEPLIYERLQLSDDSFAELVLWRVPETKIGSHHAFKYRFAYVVAGICVLRFDNEAGKGDHMHLGAVEMPYTFTTAAQLVADFWQAVADWRPEE